MRDLAGQGADSSHVGMEERAITIPYTVYPSPAALPADWQELYQMACTALDGAYAPYSQFSVGAAIALDNGKCVLGANQENAAYPSGMCAERVALYQAGAVHHGAKVLRIAIVARRDGELLREPVFPCGACRQALLEYANMSDEPVGVLMASQATCLVLEDARQLLPFAFDSIGGQ